MGDPIHAVTVYCSSSRKVAPAYFRAAEELGRGIAGNGWKLVYGGNDLGLMSALANSARSAGGAVIGVTPQVLVDKGAADLKCDELIVTEDMRQRKAIMEQRSDAFVALPGGIGTFEEIFEILVGRSLGFHTKPIVLLNIERYYDPLLQMMKQAMEQQFVRAGTMDLWFVTSSVPAALLYLQQHAAPVAATQPSGPDPPDPTGAQTPQSAIE